MTNLPELKYAASEKEVGCDDVDKDDKGDRVDVTRLTDCIGLYLAALGCNGHPDVMGS